MGSRRVLLLLICALLSTSLVPTVQGAAVEVQVVRPEPVVLGYPDCTNVDFAANSGLVDLRRDACPVRPSQRCVFVRPVPGNVSANATIDARCFPSPLGETVGAALAEALTPPCPETKEPRPSDWCCKPGDHKCRVTAMVYEVRKRVGNTIIGKCVDVRAGIDDHGTPYVHPTVNMDGSCSQGNALGEE